MDGKIKPIGGGAEYEVARDQKNVYKRPRQNIWLKLYGRADYKKVLEDIAKIQEIFDGYFAPTDVLKFGSMDYVLVQDYMKGGEELKADMSVSLQKQLIDIISRNKTLLRQYGKSLDFLGNKGNINGLKRFMGFHSEAISISNIMSIKGELKIIDLNLLDVRFGRGNWNPIHVIVDNLSYLLSQLFLRRYFGIEAKKFRIDA